MKTIAVINTYPKFDAVFDPVAGEMDMTVKRYPGLRPMADDLNAKTLPIDELALIICTGTSEENDAAQYQRNMGLLAQLAKHSKLKSVPVLFLGYRGCEDLQQSCESSCAEYLDLPVRKSELMGRIWELCGNTPIRASAGRRGSASAPSRGMEPSPDRAESERRLATIMFADISGFTAMSEKMDPEEVTGVMNGVFHEMEAVIARHGGTIDKFIGDCVMVLFGVPKALENAPLMAVNTAIEMRNSLYRYNTEKRLAIPLDIHIGMNTGSVVAGQVGGKERKDYTVMGDAVNLSSRIEGASEKGQILVGPDTFRATQNDFEYRALTPVSLKGKAEPVPIYEVLSTKESAVWRGRVDARAKAGPERMIYSEMVGRDEEMNELRFQVMKANRGEGGVVTIVGEAGIGKSRLMAELKSDPVMKQVTLLEGRAVSMGRNLPFHPVIDLLKNWAGINEDDGDTEQLSKLERAVRAVHPDEAGEIVPFAATLMGMKLSGNYAERVKGIEGEALEKLIFKNIRSLMIKGSELRPLVFHIEDLHWADTSSIELVSALFKLTEKYRVIFILVFRPNYEETGDRILHTLASDFPDRYVPVVIEPLTEKESCALIGNLMNIRGLPRQIEEQIKERAGGNPFFIEEVVRSFIDEGAVVKKGDTFTVTEKIHAVTVPMTINEVLMARIDRLDAETRELVKTASVIGRNFFHKIITRVAGNISDVETRLAFLEDIQLIRERKRMDELEYLFKHALAQEAAYESILIKKRKELHLYIAQSIEDVFNERLHEFYGMLAYHYSKGENLDKAEEYMLKAGEEAMKASASSEALSYYQNALLFYRTLHSDKADPEKIADHEKNIAIALFNSGLHSEALPHFEQVLMHYGIKTPTGKVRLAIRFFIGFIYFFIALYFPCLIWKRKPGPDFEKIMRLNFYKSQALSYINPPRFFIENFIMSGFAARHDFSSSRSALMGFSTMSPMLSYVGMFLDASKRVIDIIEKYKPEGDTLFSLGTETAKSFYNFFTGNWNTPFNENIVKESLAIGEVYMVTLYIFYTHEIALHRGDMSLATRLNEMLKSIADDYNNKVTRVFQLGMESMLLMHLGRFHEAEDKNSLAILKGHEISPNLGRNSNANITIVIKIAVGKKDEAKEEIKYFHSIEKKMIPFVFCLCCINELRFLCTEMEEVSAGKKDQDYASQSSSCKKIISELAGHLKKVASIITPYYRHGGSYYWITDKKKKALRWWKKSIDEGERLGARLELSRTYFEVGKRLSLPGGDDSNRRLRERAKKIIGLTPGECLDRAEAMFREMGLEWDLAELEKVRAQVKGYNA